MAVYDGPLHDWLLKEWKKVSDKKLDMGKSCIRFKKPADIPVKLFGELATKMTPHEWIERYTKSLKKK